MLPAPAMDTCRANKLTLTRERGVLSMLLSAGSSRTLRLVEATWWNLMALRKSKTDFAVNVFCLKSWLVEMMVSLENNDGRVLFVFL